MQSWYFERFGINADSTAEDYLRASEVNQVQILGKICYESLPCVSTDLAKEYGRENVIDIFQSNKFDNYIDNGDSTFQDKVTDCFLDEIFGGASYQKLGVISLNCGDKIAGDIFKAAGL